MVLIRLLMLLLVAWIGWRIYRLLTRPGRGSPEASAPVEDMVQCARCAVHLPRGKALRHGELWFCGEAHRVEHDARR